jgi:hypothetical protein
MQQHLSTLGDMDTNQFTRLVQESWSVCRIGSRRLLAAFSFFFVTVESHVSHPTSIFLVVGLLEVLGISTLDLSIPGHRVYDSMDSDRMCSSRRT